MNANMNTVLNTVPSSIARHEASDLLSSLPVELLDSIVARLDLKSLARLACTCRLFSSFPLVVQHPDFTFLQSLARKDVAQFRTLFARNGYLDLVAQGYFHGSKSLPRRSFLHQSCLWILVAHLSESSAHFWSPLALLGRHFTYKNDVGRNVFLNCLIKKAVSRHHDVGVAALSVWAQQQRLSVNVWPLISDLSSNTSAIANLPEHTKSNIKLSLFQMAETCCTSSYSRCTVPGSTCVFSLLAATEDLAVILQGLLHLSRNGYFGGQTSGHYQHYRGVIHDGAQAIQRLLSTLLHRGRRDLFDELMQIWLLVLAKYQAGYYDPEYDHFREEFAGSGWPGVMGMFPDEDDYEDDSNGSGEQADPKPPADSPLIQLDTSDDAVDDFEVKIMNKLALQGLPSNLSQEIVPFFKKNVCSSELNWVFNEYSVWSVPGVLDGWIDWLLTHTHSSISNAVIIGRNFFATAKHLSRLSFFRILLRIPIRCWVRTLSLPHTFDSQHGLNNEAFPLPIPQEAARAHAIKLNSAIDALIQSDPTCVKMSEATYWTRVLPELARSCPEHIMRFWTYQLPHLRRPDLVPLNTIPFPAIMDALIDCSQYEDALKVLREVQELVAGSKVERDELRWLLSTKQCQSFAAVARNGAERPKGMEEFLVYVWENKLCDESLL